jgi:hypothetical protein
MRRNKQNQLKGNRKLFSPVSKKIIALGVMLVMGSAVFFAPSVFAQEQTMVNVEYVVQPGIH